MTAPASRTNLKTSGESNLTKAGIATTHGSFNRICLHLIHDSLGLREYAIILIGSAVFAQLTMPNKDRHTDTTSQPASKTACNSGDAG